MKINIYYGGRGIIDDPSLYVTSMISEVLSELNVKVRQINLYEAGTCYDTVNYQRGVLNDVEHKQ